MKHDKTDLYPDIPTGIYLLKVNNRNTRTRCEICSKLTIKIPERRHIFIVNFEHISHLVLVFLFLTLTCNCRLCAISIYTVNNWIVALEDCIEPVYDVKNIIKNNKVKLAEYASKLHCNLFRHLDSVNKILSLEKRLSSGNCFKMCLIHAPNDRQRMS